MREIRFNILPLVTVCILIGLWFGAAAVLCAIVGALAILCGVWLHYWLEKIS